MGNNEKLTDQTNKAIVASFEFNWKVFAFFVMIAIGAMGIVYAKADRAEISAYQTREWVSTNFVTKEQYRLDIEALNKKMDFLIDLHLNVKQK